MCELGQPMRDYYFAQKEKKNRVKVRVSLSNCFRASNNEFSGNEKNFLDIFGEYTRTKTKWGYKCQLKASEFCNALQQDWKSWKFRIYPSNSQVGVRLDTRSPWVVTFNVYAQTISFSGGLKNTGPYDNSRWA
eukprot:UN08366